VRYGLEFGFVRGGLAVPWHPRHGSLLDLAEVPPAAEARQLLIGTIDRLNTSWRKTAQAAGRRRVLDAVFVSLGHFNP
jgi:hypothetical protein